MRVGDKIRALRKRDKMTQGALAKKLGVAPTAVSAWERNANRPLMDKLTIIADLFNVPLTHFFDEDQPTNIQSISPQTVRIPILGKIACGNPIDAEENIEGYLYKSPDGLPSGDLIALHVKGDSMAPTIPNKAYVIVRRQSDAETGELVAVRINGDQDATLKRLKKQGNTIILMPDNQKYDPIVVTEDNPITMIGKVVSYEVRF